MTLRVKKIVAREFLLFICPLLILSIVVPYLQMKYNEEVDSLRQSDYENDSKLKIIADSLREADKVEFDRVLHRMERENAGKKRIEEVTVYFRLKKYEIENGFGALEYPTNIYGEKINFPSKLVQNKKLLRKQIWDAEAMWERIVVSKWNTSGNIFGFYVIFLIAVYPFRFLVLSIMWSVSVLRAKP